MEPVSQAEIASLTRKLESWGSTLSPKEHALVELIVNRARLVHPNDVMHAEIRQSVAQATTTIFANIVKAWEPQGWARIDPIWYKNDTTHPGDIVEITTRAVIQRAGPGEIGRSSAS